jgi:hypothetical protein
MIYRRFIAHQQLDSKTNDCIRPPSLPNAAISFAFTVVEFLRIRLPLSSSRSRLSAELVPQTGLFYIFLWIRIGQLPLKKGRPDFDGRGCTNAENLQCVHVNKTSHESVCDEYVADKEMQINR